MIKTIVESQYELERGKPMPSKNHSFIQSRLNFELQLNYREEYVVMTEISILIDETEKVPDLALFKDIAYTPGYDEIKVSDIPVGAIEILSPKQSLADLIAKSYNYFEAGVKSYWLVLPDVKTIFVYSAPNEYEAFVKTGMLKDTILNIELDIEKIFAVKKPKK